MTLIELKPVRRCGECFHLIPAEMKNCPYCHGDVKARSSESEETPPDEEAVEFQMKPLSPETKKRLLWGAVSCAVLVIGILVWQAIANSMVLDKSILEPLDESTVASKIEENYDFAQFYSEVSELRDYITSDEDKELYKDITYNDFLTYYNSYSSALYCDEIKQKAMEAYDKDILDPIRSRVDSVKNYWTKYLDEHDVTKYITIEIKTSTSNIGYPTFYFIVSYPKEKLSACSATLHYRDRWGFERLFDMELDDMLQHNSLDNPYNLNWEDYNYWSNNEMNIVIHSVTLANSGNVIKAEEMDQVPDIVKVYESDESEYNEVALIRQLIDPEFPSRDDYALKAVLDNLKEKNTKLYEFIERVETSAGHTIIQRGF